MTVLSRPTIVVYSKFLCCHVAFWIFCACRVFCHRTESDLFLFLLYSELLSKFGKISFQDYVSEGISHQVFYGDLVYKLRRIKGAANFISSGSKTGKRLRRRKWSLRGLKVLWFALLQPFTDLSYSVALRLRWCRLIQTSSDKALMLVPSDC